MIRAFFGAVDLQAVDDLVMGLHVDRRARHRIEGPAVDAGEEIAVALLDVVDPEEKGAGVADEVFPGLEGQGLDVQAGLPDLSADVAGGIRRPGRGSGS